MKDKDRRGYRVKQMMTQESLHAYESRCHEEDPPACESACPLHVDGRGLSLALGKGDYNQARALFEKGNPFPFLLSVSCDAPCQDACRRAEVDEAIDLRGLEAAAMAYGQAPKTRRRRTRRRIKGKVAVVGADVAGLTVAEILGDRQYEIHLFEKEDQLGHGLPEDPAFREAFEKDCARILEKDNIQLHFDKEVDAKGLEELREDYESIFIPASFSEKLSLATAKAPVFQLQDKIFSIPHSELPLESIYMVANARRSAWSMDRFMQGSGISLTEGREKEAPYPSSLPVDTHRSEAWEAIPQAPFDQESAEKEGRRCLDCHCLMCVRACPYMAYYNTYPKKLIRTVYNNLSIVAGNRTANLFINSCALCDQCRAICPTDIEVTDVIRNARETMVETYKMPQRAHEFALLDMANSQSEEAKLVKADPEVEKPAYAFFAGCQLGALAPGLLEKTYDDLRKRLVGGVGLILDCCGAIADWAGRIEESEASLDGIVSSWKALGEPKLIMACPTCMRNLKAHKADLPMEGLWTMLPEKMSLDETKHFRLQEPCSLREEHDLQSSLRDSLKNREVNFKLGPYAGDRTACCGYGGLVKYANPPVAKSFAEHLTQGEEPLLLACINCRDQVLREDKEAYHYLELFYGPSPKTPPTLGARRTHRQLLKSRLLKQFWEEDMPLSTSPIQVEISDALQAQMEERWIMTQDIQEVLARAQAENSFILDQSTGHLYSYARIGRVTFWVEVSPGAEQNCYILHDAYSHRMVIGEDDDARR